MHGVRFEKVPASSVPYGTDIAKRGRWVWIAFKAGKRVALAATRAECEDAVRRIGRPADGMPPECMSGVRRWNEGLRGEVLPGRKRKESN
jgi:hypothetical protein